MASQYNNQEIAADTNDLGILIRRQGFVPSTTIGSQEYNKTSMIRTCLNMFKNSSLNLDQDVDKAVNQ